MPYEREEITRIEELLKIILTSSFSDATSAIEKRIDELFTSYGIELPYETKQLLVIGYYCAAKEYSTAEPRQLGGPYFLHPELAMSIAIGAGASDIITLLACLFHDAIEERAEAVRKKPTWHWRLNRESKLIGNFNKALQNQLTADLRLYNISNAESIAAQVCEPVMLLTKRKKENYYSYIYRIFEQPHLLFAESRMRAIKAKFADSYANTSDLERDDYQIYPALVPFQSIIDAFQQKDQKRIDELIAKCEQLAEAHHQKRDKSKFGGDRKLHTCYKNLIVLNQYGQWLLAGNEPIQEVAAINLPKISATIAGKILDHLCTYHCHNELTPKRVFEIYCKHLEYEAREGYDCVTRPSKIGQEDNYDGMFTTVFDPKIRKGDSRGLYRLYDNRADMLRAAISLQYVFERFEEEGPTRIVKGFTEKGLEQAPPIVLGK